MIDIIRFTSTSRRKHPGGIRGYNSRADRKRAITQLRRRGFNCFVLYRDTQAEFAVQYTVAEWVGEGRAYICR
jgi:hypothetical protein